MNQFVLNIDASKDVTGFLPLPRLVGPFPSKAAARDWIESGGPIHGEWNIAPLAAPDGGRR